MFYGRSLVPTDIESDTNGRFPLNRAFLPTTLQTSCVQQLLNNFTTSDSFSYFTGNLKAVAPMASPLVQRSMVDVSIPLWQAPAQVIIKALLADCVS